MKTLWAVACPAAILGLLIVVSAGCASSPVRTDNAAVLQPPKNPAAGVAEIAVSDPPETATVKSDHPSESPPSPGSPAIPGSAVVVSSTPSVKAVPAGPVGASGPAYRIGPEDILHVSVWENKELTLDVMVRPDGKISLPLVQDVQAEGLTVVELSDVIHTRLLGYLKEPQVSVIVTQVNAPKIFIVGSVAKPGPYPLRSDMSVLQALSLAGGFTQFASPRSIKLVRGIGAKQEVRKINYYNLLDPGGEDNYLLKPGDTIVVP